MTRVESMGSMWQIDEDLKRYCRFPKQELPREHPFWGGPDAGFLQDAVWHDFEGEWRITPTDHLLIEVFEDPVKGWFVVRAPGARVLA